jgi:uncharacterized protein
MENQIYHQGELEAQLRAGERSLSERNAKAISSKIIPGAINFLQNQPFIIATTRNSANEVSVSAISGKPGYIRVIDEQNIEIDSFLVTSNPKDVFWKNIKEDPGIGLLFIELFTRRRYRINGSIQLHEGKILISILQAYPNCPKYIQQRQISVSGKKLFSSEMLTGTTFTEEIQKLVSTSDTFFVGSSDSEGRLDASHRGGISGFVVVEDSNTLVIPDYFGNSMFNTLGNFMVNPNAGLLFIDFEHRRTVQLTGTAEIAWSEELNNATGGTNRYWRFRLKKWIMFDNLTDLDWTFIEYSRFNPVN